MRFFLSRSRRNRSLVYLPLGLLCVYLVYLLYGLNDDLEEENAITSCELRPTTVEGLKELAIALRDTLDSLNLKYFLCYQTLYGAIKNHQPIPWHDTLDFCILNDQLAKQDEAYIFRQFHSNKLALRYSGRHGFYKVNFFERSKKVHARLFVFEHDEYTGNYRRIGFKYRIIPPNECSRIHCFPARLLESPLPLIQFISQDTFAIPHEQEEILKYLFPSNWWTLDTLPEKCQQV